MSNVGSGGVVDYAPVTSGTATREMAVTGMGDSGVCVGGPAVVFNFLTSPTGTTVNLDPRITFSRGSNATYFDSTGTLQYAPHNLLTYSEQFDNAAWTKSNASVTSNSIAAPDGTFTADKIVENATTNTHFAQQGFTTTALRFTASFYAKAAERSFTRAVLSDGTSFFTAYFNLAAGTVGTVTGTGTEATITPEGNGWYRCSVSAVCAAGSGGFNIRTAVANGSDNYLGDGTSGIYVWGAQLNVGALQPYYTTTVKNLQGYSQEFNNAAWTKSASSVSADATTAPDGSLTADKLVEDSTTAGHYVTPASSNALTLGQIVTYSAYAKAAERTFIQLVLTGIGVSSGNYIAGFNLSAGTAGTPTSGVTSSILDVGSGWYRCQMTVTVQTAATPTRQIRLAQNANATAASYAGDGTSGIYVWGAQFSDSASLDAYTYNPVAAPSAAAYYGPRFDYNPSTLSALGLLIEEQRTNSIRNNTMVGAVAGTPGTLPTNWSIANAAGLSTQVVGTGTESGVTYIDLRIFGTTTGTQFALNFEPTTQIPALQNQLWTGSFFAKYSAGGLTNVGTLSATIVERNSAGSGITSGVTSNTLLNTNLSVNRLLNTYTLPSATAAYVSVRFDLTLTNSAAVDVTLRIGLPQLELGAFATSVIPTSATALTRSADVATVTGANFSNWYNATAGTVYAEYDTSNSAQNNNVLSFSDGTTSNRITLRASNTSVQSAFAGANGGATQWAITVAAAALNTTTKAAGAFATDDIAYTRNSSAVGADTLATIPTVNQLRVGAEGDGTLPLNGHIRKFAYYPTRLPNGTLQALTS